LFVFYLFLLIGALEVIEQPARKVFGGFVREVKFLFDLLMQVLPRFK